MTQLTEHQLRVILWDDRSKIAKKMYPDIRNINDRVAKLEQEFKLQPVYDQTVRWKGKGGHPLLITCNQKDCKGTMDVFRLVSSEHGVQNIRARMVCVLCQHEETMTMESFNKVYDKSCQSEESTDGLPSVKPIPHIGKRTMSFLAAKLFGKEVIDEVYRERLNGCLGNAELKIPRCPYSRDRGGQQWCAKCGCGFRKDAELHTKLRITNVECPRQPPVWLPVDPNKNPELVQDPKKK